MNTNTIISGSCNSSTTVSFMTKYLIAVPRVPGYILILSKSTDCFLLQFSGTQTATNTTIHDIISAIWTIRQITSKIYKIPTEFHVLYHTQGPLQFDCKRQSYILTQERFLSGLNYTHSYSLTFCIASADPPLCESLLKASVCHSFGSWPPLDRGTSYPLPRFILEWQYAEVT